MKAINANGEEFEVRPADIRDFVNEMVLTVQEWEKDANTFLDEIDWYQGCPYCRFEILEDEGESYFETVYLSKSGDFKLPEALCEYIVRKVWHTIVPKI